MATKREKSSLGTGSSERKSVNILILGEIGIGKTTLIKTYLNAIGKSVEELIDIEELDVFVKFPIKIKFKRKVVDLGLIDLYPGANSPERRECYPTDVNVVLLCFSIGHHLTLNSVYNLWIHEVRAQFGKLIPIFLVGVRSDTRRTGPCASQLSVGQREENRVVEKIEAETIHKNYNFHGDYMECTMYDADTVTRVIKKAILTATEI